MDKLGESPVIDIQDMDITVKKEKTGVSFNEIKEKAWQESQETLAQWEVRLKNKVENSSTGINQHLRDLSVLYGETVPERIVVGLQYYPREGAQKGEPINNFVKSGRLEEETADVLYWISKPSILPTDTAEDVEAIYEDNANGAVQRILHEVQHRSFQKSNFIKLIEVSEQNPEVKAVLDKLEDFKGTHVEVTNELLTTYLENFGKKRLEQTRVESKQQTPIIIEVDKEKHGKVLEAVVREDVEGWSDKGKGPGPYTDLRQCWEKELGELLEEYQTKKDEKDVTKHDSDRSYTGIRIYEIARQLDTSLAEEYVGGGKQMDAEFIIELYKMVSKRLEEEK